MSTLFRDRIAIDSVGGSLVFNSRPERPLGSIHWSADTLDGWDRTADLAIEFATIEAVDGEEPGDGVYGGKQYEIGGYVLARDRDTARELWDSISRVFARNVDIRVEREEYEQMRTPEGWELEAVPTRRFTTVRLNGPKAVTWVEPWSFRWGVQVRAYDPFRYGADPMQGSTGVAGQIAGGMTWPLVWPLDWNVVDNGVGNKIDFDVRGTVDTKRVYATVTGPLPLGGWRIVNETTGGFLRVNLEVPPGQALTIDFSTGSMTLDGQTVTATVVGDFFALKAGAVNTIRLYAEYDPDARLDLVAYSAWE